MASVNMTNGLRDDIRHWVIKMLNKSHYYVWQDQRITMQEAGFETRREYQEAVLAEMVGEEHWGYIARLTDAPDAIFKAFEGLRINSITRFAMPVPNETGSGMRWERVSFHTDINYPGLPTSPGYYGMANGNFNADDLVMREDNKYWALTAKLYHIQWEFIRGRDHLAEYVCSFIARRNTVGQVRRDWPELVDIFPEHVQHKLGTTVARKTKDWVPVDWDEAAKREIIVERLAIAEMLPEKRNSERDKRLIIE